jgi:phage-related protein (TIGR01555 family)
MARIKTPNPKAIATTARLDSWTNAYTAQGTTADRSRYTHFSADSLLSAQQCETLFVHNDLANTIVTAIVDDALRGGFTIESTDPDADPKTAQVAAGRVLKLLTDLKAIPALREGAIWARCYGSGGVLLISPSGAQNAQLPEGAKILAVVPVELQSLTAHTYYDQDPLDPKWGEVQSYLYAPSLSGVRGVAQKEVHESRLILFPGADTPPRVKQNNSGWDLSVLQKVYEVLRGVDGNWSSVLQMLSDMSQGVLKLEGLIDMLSIEGGKERIAARMAEFNLYRSAYRTVLLDTEGEEFKYVERQLANVPDILDVGWVRLASAAEMPVTRLFQTSAKGLAATGEGDRKQWYDKISGYQRDVIGPGLLALINVLDPGDWRICFPPLDQPTPDEQATTRLKVAQADQIYIDAQVILPTEVAVSRWGSGQYSPETQIDLEIRRTVLEREIDELQNPPEPTPDDNPSGIGSPPGAKKAPSEAGEKSDATPTSGGRAGRATAGAGLVSRVSGRRRA